MRKKLSQERLVLEYLDAAGVTGISILAGVEGCKLIYGRKQASLRGLVSTHWVEERLANVVVRTARKAAIGLLSPLMLERELHRAAALHGATLTNHGVVMQRATVAATALSERLDMMNAAGELIAFNKLYKRKRAAANMRGEGFMQYPAAQRRLRQVLIKMLTGQQQHGSLFDQVFGSELLCINQNR